MIGKIVWHKSGDEIKFSPTCPDLLAYYVEKLQATDSNSFFMDSTDFDFDFIDKFKHAVETINHLSDKLSFRIDQDLDRVLDQTYLNDVHRSWVLISLKYPSLPSFLRKLGNFDEDFRNINHFLHKVENSFVYVFRNYQTDEYQIDNIFGTRILGFNRSNISLGFNNLGRSSWHKFLHFDNELHCDDTNDFTKLSGKVHFNLDRPLQGSPPVDYVEWCSTHDLPVVGKTLSLGNILDLETKLTDLRKIVIRNVNEQNDKFFLAVCSN